MKDILFLIKYLIKPRRFIDIYYYLKEYKKANRTKSIIRIRASTKSSTLGEHCIVGEDSLVINSHIGRRSRIKNNCQIYNTTMGSFCALAQNVKLGTSEHPIYFTSTNAIFYSKSKSYKSFSDNEYFFEEHDKIKIDNDVWFGANSSVVGNVNIGSGAVIAYGAVVTKDVPPYAVVGGVPARIIKMRFSDDIIKRLLEIKWWNLSDAFFEKHFKLMHDPIALISFYDHNKSYVEKFRISND